MALYTKEEQVKLRVKGKVRFTDNQEDDENRMGLALLRRLINEAEGQVEMDLSQRYIAPLQTDAGDPFDKLPQRPTKELISTLCELMSVMRILETDFGSGGSTDSGKYTEKLEKRYKAILETIVGRRKVGGEETMQWAYPPLPGLRLNYQNEMADDGFMGQIHVTSDSDGGFPAQQINSPGKTFWNGGFDGDEIDT